VTRRQKRRRSDNGWCPMNESTGWVSGDDWASKVGGEQRNKATAQSFRRMSRKERYVRYRASFGEQAGVKKSVENAQRGKPQGIQSAGGRGSGRDRVLFLGTLRGAG